MSLTFSEGLREKNYSGLSTKWRDCIWKQSKASNTHCVLLLLTGSTVQATGPSRTWWVLEEMAGLRGDWNSHPHTVSSVWPSGGAVRGKNCINKAEYIVPPWNERFPLAKISYAVHILDYTTNLTPVIPGGQDSFLQRLWHSLSQEHTPEHQPQPMNLGAVRHMAQVRKCWQPGPLWGTWIIWNRDNDFFMVAYPLLREKSPAALCCFKWMCLFICWIDGDISLFIFLPSQSLPFQNVCHCYRTDDNIMIIIQMIPDTRFTQKPRTAACKSRQMQLIEILLWSSTI